MANVIAVASGKGGTGKSTIAAALATSLSAIGCRVTAADLDLGLRSLDLLLGVADRAVFDLNDAVNGTHSVQDIAVPVTGHLRLLCAPALPGPPIEAAVLCSLLRQAGAFCDYLVLDLPAGVGLSVDLARELAGLTLLVTTPDAMAARDARNTADAILSESQSPCRLVINKVSRSSFLAGGLRDLDELIDMAGIPLLGVVPEDDFINVTDPAAKSARRRKPLTEKVLEALARRVTGEYVPLLLDQV